LTSSGAFCYAELGTVVKVSGADYAYLHFGYGPFFSYMYTWVNSILVKPASLATICLTCSEYIMVLFFDVMDDCGDPPVVITKLLAIFMMCKLREISCWTY
jgi:amino acid transporter